MKFFVTPIIMNSSIHAIFAAIAGEYDTMNDAMSMGMHHLWKAYFVDTLPWHRLVRHESMVAVDMACGSGDIIHQLVRVAPKHAQQVWIHAVDPHEDMLALARTRFGEPSWPSNMNIIFHPHSAEQAHTLRWTLPRAYVDDKVSAQSSFAASGTDDPIFPDTMAEPCDPERTHSLQGCTASISSQQAGGPMGNEGVLSKDALMPSALVFLEGHVDLYTISFGLRNVADRAAALTSAYTLLRPGGVWACLEFAPPCAVQMGPAYDAYLHVLPWLGRLVVGQHEPYTYLADSIRAFPTPVVLMAEISRAGFISVTCQPIWGGVAMIYHAHKP